MAFFGSGLASVLGSMAVLVLPRFLGRWRRYVWGWLLLFDSVGFAPCSRFCVLPPRSQAK